jgi:uncharacterized protein with HEPN domain
MPRDSRAYLADILDSSDAIIAALVDMDLSGYQGSRLIRSSVEREFIIIGEAMSSLFRRFPDLFNSISHARRIVDFRNQLTHAYAAVDDTIAWAVADRDIPVLKRDCETLLRELEMDGEAD